MRKDYSRFLWRLLPVLVVCFHAIASSGATNLPPAFQTRKVSGVVTDEAGTTFPGVNVVVKGTTTGTVTSADGTYSIDVSNDAATLIFSFVGYSQQEVPIDGKTTINVSLIPDVTSLSEVVVTALGVQKESKRLGYAA